MLVVTGLHVRAVGSWSCRNRAASYVHRTHQRDRCRRTFLASSMSTVHAVQRLITLDSPMTTMACCLRHAVNRVNVGTRTAYVLLKKVGSTGKSVERMCAPASSSACARVKLLALASCESEHRTSETGAHTGMEEGTHDWAGQPLSA